MSGSGPLVIDPARSRVIVETRAKGLLAAVAHDLRILAPIAEGRSEDGVRCHARFEVARMEVVASSRRGAEAWHDPAASDAADIAGRIRREVFEGRESVRVEAVLDRDSADLTIRAQREQTVRAKVRVERSGETRVLGRCELSLTELGVGKVRVPLGAIKLEDRVTVTFDVVLVSGR